MEWLVRSMTVTRTGVWRKAWAACVPPKPPPTITTCGRRSSTWFTGRIFTCCIRRTPLVHHGIHVSWVTELFAQASPTFTSATPSLSATNAGTPVSRVDRRSAVRRRLVRPGHTSKADGEAIPAIDRHDGEGQVGELRLAEVLAGLRIHVVGHVSVRDEGHGLGPGEGRAL